MFKELMFRSPENFCRVLLVFIFLWVIAIMATFLKALSFVRGGAAAAPPMPPAPSMCMMTPMPMAPAPAPVGTFLDDINSAAQLTKIIAIFVTALELVVLMMLLLV